MHSHVEGMWRHQLNVTPVYGSIPSIRYHRRGVTLQSRSLGILMRMIKSLCWYVVWINVIFLYISVCCFLNRAKQASFFLFYPKEIYTLCSEQTIQCSPLFSAKSLCFLLSNSFRGLDQSVTNRKDRLIVNTSPALMHFWFPPSPLRVKQTKRAKRINRYILFPHQAYQQLWLINQIFTIIKQLNSSVKPVAGCRNCWD